MATTKIDEKVLIEFTTNLNQLKTQMAQIENATNKATRSMKSSFINLGSVMAGLVSVQTLKTMVQYADAWTLIDSKLKLVTSSAQHLAKTQNDLLLLSNKTRQSMEATTTLYTRLTRATESLALSDAKRLRLTETINKALVVSGATTQESASAITQLSQALASGVLRGEEFNSLTENGSELMNMLATSLRVTTGELRAMSKDGKLTTEVVLKGLADGADDVDEKFDKMNTTVAQSFEIFKNGAGSFIDDINDMTGATASLAIAIEAMGNGFAMFDWDNFFNIPDKDEIHKNLNLPMEQYEITVKKAATHWSDIKIDKEDIEDLDKQSLKMLKTYLDKIKTEKEALSESLAENLWNEYDAWFDSAEANEAIDTFNDNLAKGLAQSLATALVGGDVRSAIKSLGGILSTQLSSEISSSMINSGSSTFAAGAAGGVMGLAVGFMFEKASTMLFQGIDSGVDLWEAKQAELAASAVEFIDSLNSASEALEKLGNSGSATAYKLLGINIELDKSVQATGRYSTESKAIGEAKFDALLDLVGGVADYSKISSETLKEVTKDFDSSLYAQQQSALALIALEAQVIGGDSSVLNKEYVLNQKLMEMEDILTDPNFILGENFSDTLEEIVNQRKTLEDTLARVGLDNIELRELDILLIDESNRALQREIWAKQDALAVTEDLTEASRDYQLALDLRADADRLAQDAAELRAKYAREAREREIQANIDSLQRQQDALSDFLSDLTRDISTLEGVFEALGSVVSALRGDVVGSSYTLAQYYASMARSRALSGGTNYEAYATSIRDTINKSRALSDSSGYGSKAEQDFAKLVAASQFEEMEDVTDAQISILEQIEINTRHTVDALAFQIAALNLTLTQQADAQRKASEAAALRDADEAARLAAERAAEAELAASQVISTKQLGMVSRDEFYDLVKADPTLSGVSDTYINGTLIPKLTAMTDAELQQWYLQYSDPQRGDNALGFANGGYTGMSGGIVHPQEYVLNANTSSQMGLNDSSSTGVFGIMANRLESIEANLYEINKTSKKSLNTERQTLDLQIKAS